MAGALGGIVAFLLYLEYIGQLTDAAPLISCAISPIVTCGPNLLSPGGNLLGFSNSIIGIVLFGGPVYAGVSALAAPGGLRPWYWRVYGLFVLGGFLLVHFFAWRSVFEYGSLCPWCMIVWLVTIPLFWFTLGWSLRDGVWGRGDGVRRRRAAHPGLGPAHHDRRLRDHRDLGTGASRRARLALLTPITSARAA